MHAAWAILLLLLVVGCRKERADGGDSWAVGTYIGGGSVLFGPGTCTYDAPPDVAELSRDQQGVVFMAKLVGEGSISERCNGRVTAHPVRRATALRMDGPSVVRRGMVAGPFSVVPLAGATELRGVHQGGTSPTWSLAPDCAEVAEVAPVLGASDTGGPSIQRTLVALRAGTCTIEASVLGVSTRRAIKIE